MSDKDCCVPGCKESGSSHPVLHGFPNPATDRERFNTWLYAIDGNLLNLENERIYKYRRVCRSHFEEKYLCRNNRLSNIAVPTLNMPDLLTKMKSPFVGRKPMQQVLNQTKISTPADPEIYQELAHTSSVNIHKDIAQKENIDPAMMHQHSAHTLPMDVDQEVTQKEKIGSAIHQLLAQSSTINIEKDVIQKGNIDQEIAVEQALPANSQNFQVSPSNLVNIIESTSQQKSERKKTAKKYTRHLYLTPKEQELHREIVAAKIKLYKMKNKIKRQFAEIKAAKKFATNPALLQIMENCTSTAKLLIQMQWRENKKKAKGRRFTLKEKILSLSILKQSPKAYRRLRDIFILPAPQTLIKLVQRSNLRPGISQNIFSQLKKRAEKMTTEQKLCVLLFDEVSLKPHVTYHARKDKVTGFVDTGVQRTPQFADHAQVFMVRGLIYNFRQPVSYTFSSSATKGPELCRQIKEVITELQRAGLIVIATVCDQGANNRHAIRLLRNETEGVYLRRNENPKDNIIIINDQEIIPLYDPPHLLKGIRNNLLTKNLNYTNEGQPRMAKWSHIQALYKEDPNYKGIKLVPKLTENHINPEKLNKMKVKYASQVFSRTVASNMGYFADKGILPPEALGTADFLLFMDNVFDSVNGSYSKNKKAKPLLGPVTPLSSHHKFWSEAKNIFKSMKFINTAGKEEVIPSITNWIWTLEGIEVLLKKLKSDFGVTSVWLRHLNQDPLENFFAAVRSHGCRNINPTCDQFESAFATLLVNNLSSVHSPGKNCEDDLCDALYALVVDDNTEPASTGVSEVDFQNILEINLIPLNEKEKYPNKIASVQYMSGYFVKKVKSKVSKDCEECNKNLIGTDAIEYLKYREYEGRRWLCTPSLDVITLISNIQDIITEILSKYFDTVNLKEVIKTSIYLLIDFDFIKCKEHKNKVIDYLINYVVRFFVFNYCKIINKILTGRKDIDDDEDQFQVKAKKNYTKCFKRRL